MSISDQQVRRLRKLMERQRRLNVSASAAGMDEKTARKYLKAGKLPSEMNGEHTWRTREDPFEEVWKEARGFLELNEGLEAKTIFEYLARSYPERFSDGQLRTFQRKVKQWRATEGPPREVFFGQIHHPGRMCQSDFTFMHSLGVTIGGQPFDHLVYHFVLTCSVKGHHIPHPPGSRRFPTWFFAPRFSIHPVLAGVSKYHFSRNESVTGRLADQFPTYRDR